jgi:hypothetical protein
MDTAAIDPPRTPTFAEALRFWLKLGFVSFGGPAGQIAIMHRELVERDRWISERRFLHALNYCPVPKRSSWPLTSVGCCTGRAAASSPARSSCCPRSPC